MRSATFNSRRLSVLAARFGVLVALLVPAVFQVAQANDGNDTVLVTPEHGEPRMVGMWREMVMQNEEASVNQKLRAVNDFFNQFQHVEDQELWGMLDYWATPGEVLELEAGDCEDMSIAKFFTLRRLGVPADSLRITYVKLLSRNLAHMVLTYYEQPNSEPLVLDTLDADIKPASTRVDLKPVYSFNAELIWVSNDRYEQRSVGTASQMSAWTSLLDRVVDEQNTLAMLSNY